MKLREIDKLNIATIRSFAIDMINKANSGHPGMAIGSAPILYTLFRYHLIANPKNPTWINRDRFVLSSGHASSLLYTILHLCGYKIGIDDLKSFRQLGSLTPGHPEVGHTPGVDATSGPLGQGIAQAVGLALAEEAVANQYVVGDSIINHYTYCLCGDGCLQEGISQEAISFAGHQKLNKLILFYDCNDVTLDGSLSLSFSEKVKERFLASNWNVIYVEDGNDIEKINKAIVKAKKSFDKPNLIMVHTTIGYGSSKAGTNKCHGSPLGLEDGKATKLSYGFDHEDFYIPEEVYADFKSFMKRGKKAEKSWNKATLDYSIAHKEDYDLFIKAVNKELPNLDNIDIGELTNDSTRVVSGKILNYLHKNINYIMGGSADVASSVQTNIKEGINFDFEHRNGRVINFGIREFAMTAILNGMALHGALIPYGGSFFVFSDYMKPAIRLAALSKLPVIYLFSHDTVAVGEDGPTHQPIEQLTMLRSIPNVNVIRPCDAKETIAAYKIALTSKETPTSIILSRQGLPLLSESSIDGAMKGAYVVSKEENKIDRVLLVSGSEVSLALECKKILKDEGIDLRIVSIPSPFIFDKQNKSYKKEVLPVAKSKIIAIEMGSTMSWYKYADEVIGIDTFGTSAPQKVAMSHFGFDVAQMCEKIRNIIK